MLIVINSELVRWRHSCWAAFSISLHPQRRIGLFLQISAPISRARTISVDNLQIARKISKRPTAEPNLVTMHKALEFSLCPLANQHIFIEIKHGKQLQAQNNKESPGRRAESEERRERFVTVVSENKRFLFTPPNGCEHFLNTAQSVCIRKVKGTAPISTPKSYLIYKVSRQVQYDSLIGVDWHNLRKLQASLQGMGSWRAAIFSSTVAYCLPNPRVKKLCMVSVWILFILRVGNERFVQNLITEVKVQETSLKMKARNDSSGKLREQSALLIWASGSIWLVLYLAAAPSPSSKCSRWPRELPLGNWILSTGLSAGTTLDGLRPGLTFSQINFFDQTSLTMFVTWCSSQFFFL